MTFDLSGVLALAARGIMGGFSFLSAGVWIGLVL